MLASLHDLLAHKRPTFFLSCLLLLLVCGLWTWRLRIGENAAAMLPHGGQVAADFALLQSAPFAQRLAVSLEDSGQIGADALTETAATVAAAMEALGPPPGGPRHGRSSAQRRPPGPGYVFHAPALAGDGSGSRAHPGTPGAESRENGFAQGFAALANASEFRGGTLRAPGPAGPAHPRPGKTRRGAHAAAHAAAQRGLSEPGQEARP